MRHVIDLHGTRVKPALTAMLILGPITLGVSAAAFASPPDHVPPARITTSSDESASGSRKSPRPRFGFGEAKEQVCEGRGSALQSAVEEANAARRLSEEVSAWARIGGDSGITAQLAHWRSVEATEREKRLRFELAACRQAGLSRR